MTLPASAREHLPPMPSPVLGPPPRLPTVDRFDLESGLVAVLDRPLESPTVHLSFVAPAGGLYDPAGTEGLAALTASLLREGSQRRPGQAIAAAVGEMGAGLRTRVDWNVGSLGVELLAEDLERGIDLLLELVGCPSFPDSALQRSRQRSAAESALHLSQPGTLAARCFARAVDGGLPYGRSLFGDARSVSQVTREDLLRFHSTHYHARGSLLICLGGGRLRSREVMARLESQARQLPVGAAPSAPALGEPPPLAPRVLLVELPETTQTSIRLGHSSVPLTDPDSDRLRLLTTVLGGGLSSRLNRRLRQELGYTYQVQSLLPARWGRGLFVVGASVGSDVVGPALRIMVREIERLQETPISESELRYARNRLTGIYFRTLRSSHGLACHLARLLVRGFSLRSFQDSLDRIHDTTAKDLLELARRHLHPDALTVAAVGQGENLRPQLEGLGELTVVEAADVTDFLAPSRFLEREAVEDSQTHFSKERR